jgi:hypothetical protein
MTSNQNLLEQLGHAELVIRIQRVIRAQDAYWRALGELERVSGRELRSDIDWERTTVAELLAGRCDVENS